MGSNPIGPQIFLGPTLVLHYLTYIYRAAISPSLIYHRLAFTVIFVYFSRVLFNKDIKFRFRTEMVIRHKHVYMLLFLFIITGQTCVDVQYDYLFTWNFPETPRQIIFRFHGNSTDERRSYCIVCPVR